MKIGVIRKILLIILYDTQNFLPKILILDPGTFIEFLARHDFVFSIFPSKYFVSVRHNLPYFNYTLYIQEVRLF